jgi:hypothetical protein
MSNTLRSKVIRLAHQNPELRPHLLPLLKEGAEKYPKYKFYVVHKKTGLVVAGNSTKNDAEDTRKDLPLPAKDLSVKPQAAVMKDQGVESADEIEWATKTTLPELFRV